MIKLIAFIFIIFTTLSMNVFANSIQRNAVFEWEGVADSTGYELELAKKNADGSFKKPVVFKSKNPSWSGSLAPGIYNMRLRAFDDRAVPSDWSEASEVLVQLPKVETLSPQVNALIQTDSEVEKELPDGMYIAYDGLKLEVTS
jgi:hypothetical protein